MQSAIRNPSPRLRGASTIRIGWFSTGRDPAARDLLTTVYDSIQNGIIPGEISFVFSNRERGEGEESDKFLDLVESLHLPLATFSSRRFKPQLHKEGLSGGLDSRLIHQWRSEYDREVINRLKSRVDSVVLDSVVLDLIVLDLIVLAGYMLILSPRLCERFPIINLHPALPGGPKGTWQEVIWELIERRMEETGVMIHLVSEVLDEGPPITYCKFAIKGEGWDKLWKDLEDKLKIRRLAEIIQQEGEQEALFKEIRKQGVIRELPLLVHTIGEFAVGNLKIMDGKLLARGKVCNQGYDLTEEIDRLI